MSDAPNVSDVAQEHACKIIQLFPNISEEIENRLKHEIPLRRFGETSNCGAAAVFLLSDALSAYTTGAELVVDGGLSLRPLYFGEDADLAQLNT